MSDFFFGARDGKAAALGGLDVEMPVAREFGPRFRRMVKAGLVPVAIVDEAVQRILRQKIRFANVGEPDRYRQEAVAGEAHRALAREAGCKSAVLLKNEPLAATGRPLLPLDPTQVRRIALLGRLAAEPNPGDLHGSSTVRPPAFVTPLQGLRTALGTRTEITYCPGRDLRQAVEAVRDADVALVVAGFTTADEGERIRLPGVTWGGTACAFPWRRTTRR